MKYKSNRKNSEKKNLRSKALSVGAVMLAVGLVVGTGKAFSAEKKSNEYKAPPASGADEQIVHLNFGDILYIFSKNGSVPFDLVSNLLNLSQDEEKLFSSYINENGIISVDDALMVTDELDDRFVVISKITAAIDQSPALKRASDMLRDFIDENGGRVPSSAVINEIAAKTGLALDIVSLEMEIVDAMLQGVYFTDYV